MLMKRNEITWYLIRWVIAFSAFPNRPKIKTGLDALEETGLGGLSRPSRTNCRGPDIMMIIASANTVVILTLVHCSLGDSSLNQALSQSYQLPIID